MSEGTWRRRELIVQLDDEEYRDVYAWDMLSVAASHGDFSLVTEIIKHGHVDIKGYYGTEALLSAIDSEHWSVMIKLLESGADPHYQNQGGENALDVADSVELSDKMDNLLREYNYPDLFTMVSDLHNKYEMAVKMQQKYKRNLRNKKSRKNKRVLHKYMEPSQRRVDSQGRPRFPQYSNLAQVALAQPNITRRIAKHLPKDWSMRGGKKSKKKNTK